MSRFPPSGTKQLKFITKERNFGLRGGGGIPLFTGALGRTLSLGVFSRSQKNIKNERPYGGVELTIWEVYMQPELEVRGLFRPRTVGGEFMGESMRS